jgi:serine/threonine protein kinase
MSGILEVGNYTVRGVNAEILSVLMGNNDSGGDSFHGVKWSDFAHAFDTSVTADERVGLATELLRMIQNDDQIAKWIPRYDQIFDFEYNQAFFEGYRDHCIHTLHVWLFGHYLFETVSAIRIPLKSYIEKLVDIGITLKDPFNSWWTIASLWHDCAYPFECEAFQNDPRIREKIFITISKTLSDKAFLPGFNALGINIDQKSVRTLYMAGRFRDFELFSTLDLLTFGEETKVIDEMWRNFNLPIPDTDSAEKFIDKLTTSQSRTRGPYHDHGHFGSLLLQKAYLEASSFLSEVIKSLENTVYPDLNDIIKGREKNNLEEDVIVFNYCSSLLNSSAQAIAFHNLDFSTFEIPKSWLDSDGKFARPIADVHREPHLAFLSLVDSLQCWDRHGFVARFPFSGTPESIRSEQILIQGDGEFLRMHNEGRRNFAESFQENIEQWISGTKDIITTDAKFSLPHQIKSIAHAPTLFTVYSSSAILSDLTAEIHLSANKAREVLAKGGDRAIIETSRILESSLNRISQQEKKMTESDTKKIQDLQSSEFNTIEKMAAAVVKPGVYLPIGRVEEKIGEGGFGEVYRVLEENRGGCRLLAFKLFHAQDLGNRAKRAYFKRGFEAMEALRHERRVVKVDKLIFAPFGISMDFIDGINLEDGLRELKDPHVTLSTLHSIASTLATAHQTGIIHRDVKPANVMLDYNNNNEPVLTDFDLAHFAGKTTRTQVHFASQLYGAPEQFNKRVDEWSRHPCVDVYGFGALTFNLLTFSDPPIAGIYTDDHWKHLHRTLDGKLPAAVVEKLVTLIQNCTIQDATERIRKFDADQPMEIVIKELSECIIDAATLESGLMSKRAWLQEVIYRFNSQATGNPFQFESRTGSTTWSLDFPAHIDKLIVECMLNREPRMEGVNYHGFRKASAQQVDRILDGFGKLGKEQRAIRHGSLNGTGTKMRIELILPPSTRREAHAIGGLLAAIARAVE